MVPVHRTELVMRTVDDEVVILDRTSGAIHRLNATASCIWNSCDGHRSEYDIAVRLADTVGSTPQDVLRDVIDMIHTLERLCLVTVK